MGAEYQVNFVRAFYFCQDAVDAFDDGGDVVGMVVEMVNYVYRGSWSVLAIPFVEAASGRGERIVRIEREKDQLVVRLAVEGGDGLSRVGVPIAHGDDGASGNVGFESRFESAGLLFGEAANGRAAADFGVVLADYFGAGGG